MVRRFTPHARPAVLQRQHVDTLSRSQKFDFFTKAIDTSHGRCMGYAVTMHRGCLKPVANHRWAVAMEDLIETAEDDTLQPGQDLEEVCIDLAYRLSCHYHNTQERSQLALLKAIKVYRRTFAMDDPIQQPQHVQPQYIQPQYTQTQHMQPQHVQPQQTQPQDAHPQYTQPQHVQLQHEDYVEDFVSEHSRDDSHDHLATAAGPSRSFKSEDSHYLDSDAALAKAFGARLDTGSNSLSSRAQGKKAVPKYSPVDYARQDIQHVRSQRNAYVEDSASGDARSDHGAHPETAGPSRAVRSRVRDPELEAALERIHFLEACLEVSPNSPVVNPAPSKMPDPTHHSRANSVHREPDQQQGCSCMACILQDKQERDIHSATHTAQKPRTVVPKKEKSITTTPEKMAALFEQFVLFMQQQQLMLDGEESE
jgi:hypothetical protein